MRTIDLETWPRRDHFHLLSRWAYPHFGLCANVDVTALRSYRKEHEVSFTVAVVYLVARVANEIPEFRYRIRGDAVIEHEVVHPSTTILTGDDVFSFCTIPYSPGFGTFAIRAAEQIAQVKAQHTLEDEQGADNLLFMTAIPWVSFTGFMHALDLNPADSVPRFAWGKVFAEAGQLKMPLSVQAHHALVDGLHVGRYYQAMQAYMSQPEVALGGH